MKKRIFLFISSVIVLIVSCEKTKNDACLSYLTSPAIEAEGPTTGIINQEIPFTVTHGIGNGCGSFFKFEELATANNTVVKVIAKYEGCICTAIYVESKKDYIFKKTLPGTYKLQFDKGDGSLIVREIIIQ